MGISKSIAPCSKTIKATENVPVYVQNNDLEFTNPQFLAISAGINNSYPFQIGFKHFFILKPFLFTCLLISFLCFLIKEINVGGSSNVRGT